MGKKFLYVSNYDPSQLLPHLRDAIGLECDSANNRYEALKALKTREYVGVIMTDLILVPGVLEPGETSPITLRQQHEMGLDVARAVKQKGLPLLVLTGCVREYEALLRQIGAEGVFQKVIQSEEFFEAAKKLFRQ